MAEKHEGSRDWQVKIAEQLGLTLIEDEYYDVLALGSGSPPYGAPSITRFDYLKGLKCRKLFWTFHHEPWKISPYYDWSKGLADDKEAMLELAQSLCPSIMPWTDRDDLKSHLSQRKAIFRAVVGNNEISATVDMLRVAKDGKWDIIQISLMTAQSLNFSEKYKLSALRRYVQDLAFQKHCCELSNISIGACYLAHLDGNYIRKGKLDSKVLTIRDLTRDVELELPKVAPRLDELLIVAGMSMCPPFKMFEGETDCLTHSHLTGFHCPLIEECRESMDGARKPLPKLDDTDFDLSVARKIFDNIRYPLHIVDLGCLHRAIPIEGGKPYSPTPFVLSILSINDLESEPKFQSWLWDGKEDACKQMFCRLMQATGVSGSILFEFGKSATDEIFEIAERYPEHLSMIKSMTSQAFETAQTIKREKSGELAVNGVYYLDSLFPESCRGISPDDRQIEEWIFIKTVFEKCHLDSEELQLTLKESGNRRTMRVLEYLRELHGLCPNN